MVTLDYKVNWLNLPGGKVIVEYITVHASMNNGEYLGKTILFINEIIHGQKYINDFARCRIRRWYPNAILASK